ncbi:MAG: hypothetical protein OEX07_10905 [Gammaproteobacteria bacterium]|nr:hypothetical protein [Gammaproteobacteria bacterium]
MKKSILTMCVLSLAAQASFATQNRVAALGGETAMIVDDDTNIDLFPQHINRQNLFRLTSVDTGTPNYALITGESGKKWGLFGGTAQQNDFLDIYKSLDANSAIKLGFSVGRHSEENVTDNKEASPADSKITEKNSYFNLAVNGTYGTTKGDTEMAIQGIFAYGPNAISGLASGLTGPFGTYEGEIVAGGATTKADGEGNQFALSAIASVRKPMKIAMFNQAFAQGSFTYGKNSDSSDSTAGGTTTVDRDASDSSLILAGRVLLFDEKKIGEKSKVIYGMAAGGYIRRDSATIKASTNDPVADKQTITELVITAPQVRMGLESDMKYGVLRFGIARNFTLLNYDSRKQEPENGAAADSNSQSTFDIATTGSYTFSSGVGFNYKNLQLDLNLNNTFWVRGPQFLFDSAAGQLGTSADLLYTF